MKNKDKKLNYIIQLCEGSLKVVKCSRSNSRVEFLSLKIHPVASVNELPAVLSAEGLSSNELLVSLPRNQATCRFLKVPANSPEEIESISGLQAGRYLPYPAQDLVTAYQVIRADKDRFSDIVLTIAHRNSISNYLNILSDKFKRAKLSIILSSYGICNLYYRL